MPYTRHTPARRARARELRTLRATAPDWPNWRIRDLLDGRHGYEERPGMWDGIYVPRGA